MHTLDHLRPPIQHKKNRAKVRNTCYVKSRIKSIIAPSYNKIDWNILGKHHFLVSKSIGF